MVSPADLLLAYYGDDFTGSTDALEALTRAGVPTVLFLGTPDAATLARLRAAHGARAIGIAGTSRSRSPQWMQQHLAPALAALAALRPPLLQYKVCSTFDSAPQVGSIGQAIELGLPLMGGAWSPLIVGVPQLGRYQAFGQLFARAGDGSVHRLDRHPTMSRHPVTPMAEADLRLHLAAQTARRIGLVDCTQLQRDGGDAALRGWLAPPGSSGMNDARTDAPAVFLDVLDEASQRAAGRLVWEQRGAGLFSASSSGLQYALAAHWQASGIVEAPRELAQAAPAEGPIAAVSGSCSPVTAAQIAWAEAHGFAVTQLSVPALLGSAETKAETEAEVGRAVAAAGAALRSGRSALVCSARGPDDAAVRDFDRHAAAAGLARADAAQAVAEALARVMRTLLDAHPALRRIAVAGGDSSGEVAAALGVQALTMAATLVPGAPLCRAASADARREGLELVLKGGQMGGVDFFGRVRDGAAAGPQSR